MPHKKLVSFNPFRFEDCKEIDLVKFLPNHLRGSEVEPFLKVFENYLNDMYSGSCKFVEPDLLQDYTNDIDTPLIWTDTINIVTSKGANFLDDVTPGDYIRRRGESKYYKILEIFDDETLYLTEDYNDTLTSGSSFQDTFTSGTELQDTFTSGSQIQDVFFCVDNDPDALTAYYDNFSIDTFRNFWKAHNAFFEAPFGADGTFPAAYTLNTSTNRAIHTNDIFPTSRIATGISGDFELEFGMHLGQGTSRDNTFGVVLTSGSDTSTNPFISVLTTSADVILQRNGIEEARLPIPFDNDNYVVKIIRDFAASEYRFELEGTKSESVSATWSDSVSNTPRIGHFNKWRKTIPFSLAADQEVFRMIFVNGLNQGFDHVYFKAECGFIGRLDPVTSTIPATSGTERAFKKGLNHISILEKIKRITELHDPDLIDIEFIQFFANYLGYKVDLSRENLGIVLASNENQNLSDFQKKELEDKYLRFIVRNLPNWYRIKSSRSALNIMLFSFGLIADISTYFATNYGDFNTFILKGPSSVVPTVKHFVTPHFHVVADLDQSLPGFTLDQEKMQAVTRAILSVKPINTVFRGVNGYLRRTFGIGINGYITSNLYTYIKYEIEDWQDNFTTGQEIQDTFLTGDQIQDVLY